MSFFSMAKRVIDVGIAGVALVCLSPLMFLCALLVRFTSPGPTLYRQRRLGLVGTPFWLCKFRSMYENASDLRNPDGSVYTGEDDPRVTPVGRILRKTSLDELPQLLNVLRGEMSLVGPRPDQVDQLRYYTPAEMQKLDVKPGITGLAQISGRNSIPWTRRKELDVEYVKRRSPWLDLKILLKTIPYVLIRKDVNTSDPLTSRPAGFQPD